MRLFSLRGKWWLVVLLVLLALAAGAWFNRAALLRWYCLRELAAATEQERATWVERVAEFDEDAVPGLLAHLAREEVPVCANAEAALSCLVGRWGTSDERTLRLVRQMAERFDQLSAPGQEAGLELVLAALTAEAGQPAPAPLVEAAKPLLSAAAQAHGTGVRLRALALAEKLIEANAGWGPDIFRAVVVKGLAETDPECRVRAVHLTLHAALRKDTDLQRKVVPLLRDDTAEVRRAALLAVGLAEQVIAEDDLLPLLHDPDAEVRRLCEGALRARGLEASHLKLARLISSRRAEDRLKVVQHLQEAEDLDPGVWLKRLSQDADLAVRFAAMATADRLGVELGERLLQMRDGDPSPTVRQWAAYYLQRRPKR